MNDQKNNLTPSQTTNSVDVGPEMKPDMATNIASSSHSEDKIDLSLPEPLINSQPSVNVSSNSSLEANDYDTVSANNDEKNSRTGTLITILLIVIIIGGIWQANKDNRGQNGEINDEVNIVVDSSKETGNVTIVNGETQVNQPEIKVDTVKISAFYNKSGVNECEQVVSYERVIEKKYDSEVINTVRGLLTPLSDVELKAGLISNIPPETYLRSITVTDGVAKAVFSSALNKVAGSCRVLGIRAQIEKTLKQFLFIKAVTICIDDNCNQSEILQP